MRLYAERMTTRWLDDEEMATWLRLMAVTQHLPAELDSRLRRRDRMTHFEYQVLAMLSESETATLQMSALARRTNSSLPRLSHVVRRLEGRGLVRRSPSPGDRRATRATLTQDGRHRLERAAPDHLEAVRQHVFDALTPEQVRALGDALGAILQTLDPGQEITGRSAQSPSA